MVFNPVVARDFRVALNLDDISCRSPSLRCFIVCCYAPGLVGNYIIWNWDPMTEWPLGESFGLMVQRGCPRLSCNSRPSRNGPGSRASYGRLTKFGHSWSQKNGWKE